MMAPAYIAAIPEEPVILLTDYVAAMMHTMELAVIMINVNLILNII